MSAYYDLYQTPDPLGENRNEPRLHARILPRGTISADKFRELVAKATGFSPDVYKRQPLLLAHQGTGYVR